MGTQGLLPPLSPPPPLFSLDSSVTSEVNEIDEGRTDSFTIAAGSRRARLSASTGLCQPLCPPISCFSTHPEIRGGEGELAAALPMGKGAAFGALALGEAAMAAKLLAMDCRSLLKAWSNKAPKQPFCPSGCPEHSHIQVTRATHTQQSQGTRHPPGTTTSERWPSDPESLPPPKSSGQRQKCDPKISSPL